MSHWSTWLQEHTTFQLDCVNGGPPHCINGYPFDKNRFLHTAVLGHVQERTLTPIGAHPYHQHVYPFQIVSDITNNVYFQKGDWHDVIMIDAVNMVRIRYNPTVHLGKIMIHCHRLDHEDQGMMAMENVLDDGQCQCDANIPTVPTTSPSSNPTTSHAPTNVPTLSSQPSTSQQPSNPYVQPNIIIMQPDDLNFYTEWTPPQHFPTTMNGATFPANYVLRNMERLRTEGLQMMEAYTASPKCGTSRYSTMTGRYPSRSSMSRSSAKDDGPAFNEQVAMNDVTIPNTKLQDRSDVEAGDDCSHANLARLFNDNSYRTGFVGKWHLHKENIYESGYTYAAAQDEIRNCGFDFAEAVYIENLNTNFNPTNATGHRSFTHNMEYVTQKAIDFITGSTSATREPFFLYLNPTVPHGSGDVSEALYGYDCTITPEGTVPITTETISLMSNGQYTTCTSYRQSIQARATTDNDNALGAIWVDDSIGAVLQALEDIGELENTFFLFQMDHGQEGKESIYEPGARLAQFIHYPAEFGTSRMAFDGMVSTIDIGPTVLDYAQIVPDYDMDGLSWRSAVEGMAQSTSEYLDWVNDRCLFTEMGYDRSVRCGCNKYIRMVAEDQSTTWGKGLTNNVAVGYELLFDLCDSNGDYIDANSNENNPEMTSLDLNDSANSGLVDQLRLLVDCHMNNTDPSIVPDYTINCDGFALPTGPPTSPAPTLSLQPSVSSVPTITCVDDPDWRYISNNNVLQDCKRVAAKPEERCDKQGEPPDERPASEACALTCNSFCQGLP